jgi:hypothetical protein
LTILEKPEAGPTDLQPETVVPSATGAGASRQQAQIECVDRPEMLETFADAISGVYFDGQTLRIEFAITRLEEFTANKSLRDVD